MWSNAAGWMTLNLITLIIMAFYSMMEMACVSFNRARLHYHVSLGSKRAQWLNWLLHNPSRLFGTTLIGVNVTMMVGSECARQFYSAIGLSPDIAPLTQIIIVVTAGELAPMFAARRFSEHVAMLGIPLLYASALIMAPLLFGIHCLTWLAGRLTGHREDSDHALFLGRDELQKIVEEHEEHPHHSEGEDFNTIVRNIFLLREKTAMEAMEPLHTSSMLPINATVGHLRKRLSEDPLPFFSIYHNQPTNIVGIAFPRDLIQASDNEDLRHYIRSPWFLTANCPIMEVLTQFRRNAQTVAVVLDQAGRATGLLTLDEILEEIFKLSIKEEEQFTARTVIERTVPGDMTVDELCQELNIELTADGHQTLSQLVADQLGHPPEEEDRIQLDNLHLIVKETSLLGARTLIVINRVGS